MQPFFTEFIAPLLVYAGVEVVLQTSLVYFNWLSHLPLHVSVLRICGGFMLSHTGEATSTLPFLMTNPRIASSEEFIRVNQHQQCFMCLAVEQDVAAVLKGCME